MSRLRSPSTLDAAERRLVERAEAALASGEGGDEMLRMRLRNRAEKYRELAKRVRFGGSDGPEEDAAARHALFDSLHRRLVEISKAR